MFYAAVKNGKGDIEKEAIKSLTNNIKTANFFDVTMIDLIKPNNQLYKDVQEIILNMYVKDINDYPVKRKIKDIKNLQKKHGLNELFLAYLEMNDRYISCSCKEHDIGIDLSDELRSKAIDEYNTDSKRYSIALFHSICLLSIILNNNLYNQNIDYMEEKNGDVSIIKKLKKEINFVGNGYDSLPFLIDEKMFMYIVTHARKFGEDKAKDIALALNVLYTAQLVAKYFYKSSYPKILNNETTMYKLFLFEGYDFGDDPSPTMYGLNLDVFKKRKVLVPFSGVIIKNLEDNEVESILLNEFSTDYGVYIIAIARYRNGYEIPINIPIHIDNQYAAYAPKSNIVFDLIYSFYGIKENDAKYEVISPYYWKYRDKNYETNSEKESRLKGIKIKREHEIKINSFVRKIKGNPSNEALTLARKLFIELEPNTTIVKEHVRTYNKNL